MSKVDHPWRGVHSARVSYTPQLETRETCTIKLLPFRRAVRHLPGVAVAALTPLLPAPLPSGGAPIFREHCPDRRCTTTLGAQAVGGLQQGGFVAAGVTSDGALAG